MKKLLPGIETEEFTHRYTDPDTGERRTRTEHRINAVDPGVRVCDGCFLAQKCPEYQPGESCAYEIPVRVRTKEQYIALLDSMISMQAMRVFSMRMSEEVEGGYSDPNLSQEMDRLAKFVKLKSDIEEAGFSFSMKVQSKDNAEVGLISRLFGPKSDGPPRCPPPGQCQPRQPSAKWASWTPRSSRSPWQGSNPSVGPSTGTASYDGSTSSTGFGTWRRAPLRQTVPLCDGRRRLCGGTLCAVPATKRRGRATSPPGWQCSRWQRTRADSPSGSTGAQNAQAGGTSHRDAGRNLSESDPLLLVHPWSPSSLTSVLSSSPLRRISSNASKCLSPTSMLTSPRTYPSERLFA